MNKIQAIRTKNTILACAGGLLLSAELVFAYFYGAMTVSGASLALILLLFWIGNITFVLTVATGFSERFNDPSLTLAQMYWGVMTSLLCILLMPEHAHLVYILLLVITIFGVFRLKPRTFVAFAFVQAVALAAIFSVAYFVSLKSESGIELLATWVVYVCCMLIQVVLCQSMATLRSKLKARNKQLEEALKTRSQFLANMSHELRTPMNGVLGMLELLESAELNSQQKRYINIARSSGQSLLFLINDILDFSKLDASKLSLSLEAFALKSAIHVFIQPFYIQANEKGLDFVLDVDPWLPTKVIGDELRLRQILNNVIGNALKFTSVGEIAVSVAPGEKKGDMLELVFRVQDSGIGISEQAQQHIFESFSQADNSTTREFGGSGLGLNIARELCALMGGALSVASEEGRGSTFTLSVYVETVDEARTARTDLLHEHVLLIDYNRKRAEALARLIQYFQGHSHIVCCETIKPEEIIHTLGSTEFTQIICHQYFCTASKKDTLNTLFKSAVLSGVPVFYFGPNLDEHDHGGNGFISEPLSETQLIEAFRSRDHAGQHRPSAHCMENVEEINQLKTDKNRDDRHVLLVEDNKVNQDVAMMLLEDCDVQVDLAENGLEALDMLKRHVGKYKMVFMDCQMPQMDGYETTRAIRDAQAGEAYRNIPIVALTANVLAGDREKCSEAGMSDFIPKPVEFEQIRTAVVRWMSS